MNNEEIKARLMSAIRKLFKYDTDLLERDVGERSITHKFAEHLQLEFPNFHVDCEYNRNFGESKELKVIVNELTEGLRTKYCNRIDQLNLEELLPISTYPDVIVHIRKSNSHNLLVVEVKKENSNVQRDLDEVKLRSFTEQAGNNPYHYQLGAGIEISTGTGELREPK